MADLVTHLASALIPGVALRPHRAVLLALGTAMPDVVGRVPGLMAEGVERLGGTQPPWLTHPFGIAHQPVGGVLLAALIAWILPARERPLATLLLCGGVLLHLGVDVLQDHHGFGYHLLFPFGTGRYELGCIGSEATVPWAPWLALASVGVWGIRLGLTRWRRPGASPR